MGDRSKKQDATKAGKNKPKTKVKKNEESCPLAAKIVAVEFLDGNDKTELSGTGKHFVNLPRDNKWVDGTNVLNIDRLSQKTRLKVRFSKAGSYKFKVKYTPGGGNIAYTNTEKGRNNNFKYMDKEKEYTTDGDGTKIVATDFFVTAAGKDTYKLVAQDKEGNPPVSSGSSVEAHRLLYYQEIKMVKRLPDGTTKSLPAKGIDQMKQEFKKYNITFLRASRRGSVVMDYVENIGNDTQKEDFKTKARTAYNQSGAKAKKPYVVAVAYTDHLAVKDTVDVEKDGVEVGPGKNDVIISMVDDNAKTHSLWNNIVTNESWFVSAKFSGTKTGDGSAYEKVISKAKCSLYHPPGWSDAADDYEKVKVKVDHLDAATGTITIKVNWVDRFRGGLSLGAGNVILCCTRSYWNDRSESKQVRTLIHEMGHKLWMVADGTGKLPDKTPKHYYKRGNHCDEVGKDCVMYGVSNDKKAFCDDCTKALKKMDLSPGWSDF